MSKPTERFTNRVEDYVKYRPSYPEQVVSYLLSECELNPSSIVADIGSGTGLLTQLFLSKDMTVYGVEPNSAMRKAGEDYLRAYPHFYSINGSAENTTLKNESVDLITAGTAFHWFNASKAKQEFQRILKSPGWAALIWNVRDTERSPVMQAYEVLINQYNTDFKQSPASEFNHTIGQDFFDPWTMQTKIFPNQQTFDWVSFKGRLLSASYSLKPGDRDYGQMLEKLKHIFEQYQENNQINFYYQTQIYFGRLK